MIIPNTDRRRFVCVDVEDRPRAFAAIFGDLCSLIAGVVGDLAVIKTQRENAPGLVGVLGRFEQRALIGQDKHLTLNLPLVDPSSFESKTQLRILKHPFDREPFIIGFDRIIIPSFVLMIFSGFCSHLECEGKPEGGSIGVNRTAVGAYLRWRTTHAAEDIDGGFDGHGGGRLRNTDGFRFE